jgi:hypothetical protein
LLTAAVYYARPSESAVSTVLKTETGFQTAFLWLAGFATPNLLERRYFHAGGNLGGSTIPYRPKDFRLHGNDGAAWFQPRWRLFQTAFGLECHRRLSA